MNATETSEAPDLPFPLQDGEGVIQLCRRHWWFLWPQTIVYVLTALVPVALIAFLLDLAGILDDLGIWYWLIALVWVVYWAFRALLNWYRYHHDIWVITNQRIIDSYRSHPFNLRVSTADLINVQDMSVHKDGILPTLLNFGNIDCETAGGVEQDFKISGIPRPEDLQLLIDKERDRERSNYRGPGAATL